MQMPRERHASEALGREDLPLCVPALETNNMAGRHGRRWNNGLWALAYRRFDAL